MKAYVKNLSKKSLDNVTITFTIEDYATLCLLWTRLALDRNTAIDNANGKFFFSNKRDILSNAYNGDTLELFQVVDEVVNEFR